MAEATQAAASGEGQPESGTGGQSAQERQEWYWRRQAEKLERELAAQRTAHGAEASTLRAAQHEAEAKAREAEWRAHRLSAIVEARLPAELAELVPEAEPQVVEGYVEKLRPLAERLAAPPVRGGTMTNPGREAGGEAARLQQLAAEAARGDRRALREYAHLRERVKRGNSR